jgi:hypothetical protein
MGCSASKVRPKDLLLRAGKKAVATGAAQSKFGQMLEENRVHQQAAEEDTARRREEAAAAAAAAAAEDEAARLVAQEEVARVKAAEEEAERLKREEQERLELDRQAAEEEAERLKREEQERLEVERQAAEAARVNAEREAEAARIAAEAEAAREAAEREAARMAAVARSTQALFPATAAGDTDTVAQLCAAGALVGETDGDGCTPLCIAAREGHEDVVAAGAAAGSRVLRFSRRAVPCRAVVG